jgi:hypothetical protein
VVLTAPTDPVFFALWRKAQEFFNAEAKRLAEAREAAEKEAARSAKAGTDRHPSARVAEREVPAIPAT